MSFTHTFTKSGVTTRVLPALDAAGNVDSLVSSYEDTLEVGGFVSAAGRISEAERAANSTLYVAGATWEVKDTASGVIVFKGELNDPQQSGGVCTLSAVGWGKRADRSFDRLLFQSRDTSDWHASDLEPYNYTNVVKANGIDGDTFTLVSGNCSLFAPTGKRLDTFGTIIKHNLSGLTAGEAYEVRFEGKVDPSPAGGLKQTLKCRIWNETDNVLVTRGDRSIGWTTTDDVLYLGFKPVSGKTYSARVEWSNPYSGWTNGTAYVYGDRVNEGSLGYTCINGHNATTARKPDDSSNDPAWADATAYVVGDYVAYSGSSYRCIEAHTSVTANNRPSTGTNWETKWELVIWQTYWERVRPILVKIRYERTPNFNSPKIAAEVDGRSLNWRAKRGRYFGGESTALVYWAPNVSLTRVAFSIDKNHGTDDYKLELLGTTGPSGALTLLETWPLTAGSSKDITRTITGGPYDLLMLRLHRYETADQKHARPFRLRLNAIRVNSIATGDSYTVEQVAREIGTRLGCDLAQVSATAQGALPLDVDSETFGAVLDEVLILSDWHWGIYANASGGKVLRASPWGSGNSNTWRLTQLEAPVEIVPLERFNRLAIHYRYFSGVRQLVKVTANPNPFAAGFFSEFSLELDEPVPPLDITQAFGQTIINYLSDIRYTGQATCTLVEDDAAPGVAVTAAKIKPGDKMILSNYGNRTLRIKSVKHSEGADDSTIAQVQFADNHPLLEKVLARRSRLIALGRSSAAATLGTTDPAPPAVPENVQVGFVQREVRANHTDYDMLVDWDEVTFDDDGDGTAVRRYVAQIRMTDGSGTAVAPANDHIHKKTIDAKEDNDPSNDPDTPTRAIFRDIEKPKTRYWQARVRAVDIFGKLGAWSAWTAHYNPQNVAGAGTTAAADPSNVFFDVDQHAMTLRFDGPNDVEDAELINRDVAHFQAQVFDHNPGVGDNFTNTWTDARGRKIHDKGIRGERKVWRVSKPGTGTFYVRVRAVDVLGNKRSWVVQSGSRQAPPTPAAAPAVIFQDDDGPKDARVTAKVTFTYTGVHADDDLQHFYVEFQTATTSAGLVAGSPTLGKVVDWDGTGGEHYALFKRIRSGRWVRARYRAVDSRGHKSAFSSWS